MNKKGRRSFGYIRKLPSKLHQASYVGPDGARYYAPRPFIAKADAEGFLAHELTLINKGEWISPANRKKESEAEIPTVRQVFEEFLELRTTRQGTPLRRNTKDLYRNLMFGQMKIWLDLPLDEITLESFKKFYLRLQAEGKKTTASKCYTLMRSVLNWSVEKGLIVGHPVLIQGGYTTSTGRESSILTDVQIRELAGKMQADLSLAVMLAAYGGLRFSEFSALQRRDLIFGEDGDGEYLAVEVNRGVTKATKREPVEAGRKYELVVDDTKSDWSKRTIYLPPALIGQVKAHLATFVGASPKSLVFGVATDRSQHMTYDYFEHRYSQAKKAIGCSDVRATIHSLRSFGATLYANSGANLIELSEWLGDSSIEAVKRYIKTSRRQRSIAEKMMPEE
jgi:integrase